MTGYERLFRTSEVQKISIKGSLTNLTCTFAHLLLISWKWKTVGHLRN
jgi:hypothetical protein